MANKRTSTHILYLSAALLFTGTAAFTQQNAGQGALSAGDRKFLTSAMQGDMAEIQLGNLALQKTTNPEIKQLAQKIVDDHTKLDEQVKPIASQFGVPPPTQVPAKDQALMTKLQALSGTDFDKQYVKSMVMDHKEDDKEFKKEETSGKNQTVKDAATQGEPVIAEHLQMAEGLQKKGS